MFSSLGSFFDFSDLTRQVSEAQAFALQAPEEGAQTSNLSEMASNLSILVSFLGKIIGFFTNALGWIGGWGMLLLILAFFSLSLLNFLSPFRKSNYLLTVTFISVYAYLSTVPLESLIKFIGVMSAPALLSLSLYGFSRVFGKIFYKREKGFHFTPTGRISQKRHIPLAIIRRKRRNYYC